jgi:hypothetical protein
MDDRPAPWGHSYAAHRVLGACSHCPDYSVEEEVIQWRNRENKRYAAEQAALADRAAHPAETDGEESDTVPLATADALPGQLCPGCGRHALVVCTVTVGTVRDVKTVGGWAYCTACDYVPAACYCQPGDTPHLAVPAPTTEENTHG